MVGEIVSTDESTVTVPNNVKTRIKSITLQAGVWCIIWIVKEPTGFNNNYFILSDNDNMACPAFSGWYYPKRQVVCVKKLDGKTPTNVYIHHTSGTNANFSASAIAVKIK